MLAYDGIYTHKIGSRQARQKNARLCPYIPQNAKVLSVGTRLREDRNTTNFANYFLFPLAYLQKKQ